MEVAKPRDKKSPFQIKETFPPPYENIKIRIIAHADDLSDLTGDYYENPGDLGKLFLHRFLEPAILEIFVRFGAHPRGIHGTTSAFIQKVRICAPYTFCLIDYWLKKPQEKWPGPMKKVIKEFEGQMSTTLPRSRKRKKLKAHEVTAYIMERNFGRERADNNPASNPWTKDPNSFKKNYILKSSFMRWLKVKLKDLEEGGME